MLGAGDGGPLVASISSLGGTEKGVIGTERKILLVTWHRYTFICFCGRLTRQIILLFCLVKLSEGLKKEHLEAHLNIFKLYV